MHGLRICRVPGHEVQFQPLFSAYTYILLSYLLALALIRDSKAGWRNFLDTNKRAWKPVLAMALFGASGRLLPTPATVRLR